MSIERPRHIVLYDDRCPLCTFQSRTLGWLDWFDRLELVPLSDPKAGALAASIDVDQLAEAIHCIAPDGGAHRGARALRHIGLRMPLLAPLALLLWVPGVILVAEAVYGLVSRNRHLLSRMLGCQAACRLMPARRRAEVVVEPGRKRDTR